MARKPKKPRNSDKGRRYSDQEKREAIAAYIAKGTMTAAEDVTGIPRQTMERWRQTNTDWWDRTTQEILDFDRERRMSRLAEIVDGGTTQILDRIQNGDAKLDTKTREVIRVPVSCRDLVIATGTALDKHLLLGGKPTSISGKANESGEAMLALLKKAASNTENQSKPSSLDVSSSKDVKGKGEEVGATVTQNNTNKQRLTAVLASSKPH